MSKKTNKAKPLNATLRGLIATAATVGYSTANSFEGGVALCRSLAKSKAALNEAGRQYKAGYVVRRLEAIPAVAKRWSNMPLEQRIEAALEVMDKATPDSAKPNRRTDLEHKAVRAADVSWAACKRRAGLIAEKKGGRKPRPASNKAKAPPVDLVKASPKLADKAAANDYFATAAAALLATVDKNARIIPPQLSTAVQDFKAAVTACLNA